MQYKLLLTLVILVNATGLISGIMEPDAALYAFIAKQMAQHNDFINLYNTTDWLDKPHFPFWIIACSFKIFGINSFAYKFPAFLFWLAGTFYLYKLGKEFYNRHTALVAVLIFATAFQSVVGLFDVRGEHYLTALILGAMYYLYKLYNTNALKYVWLAALFSACAIMTKGIFFLTTIVSGFAILILIKKEWKQFSNYKWYLYLFATLLFITPELYCLYMQFDLHPEKIIYGQKDVSGLRFFFWDSQFGRFFNTGPIKGEGNVFYFFHTVIWAFLPWSILLYTAVIRLIREKNVLYNAAQWIIIGSAAITFIIFSLSQFQLPYYIIIIFPQFSLICADYLVSKQSSKGIILFIQLQRLLLILGLLALEALCAILGLPQFGWIVLIALFIATTFFYYSQQGNYWSVVQLGVGFCIIIHLFLNLYFYPVLLKYQSGEATAKWFNKHINASSLGIFKDDDFSLKFYTHSEVFTTDTLPVASEKQLLSSYYFTSKRNADSLLKAGLPVKELQSFTNFHISKLTAAFLYKQSRPYQLDTTVIFKLN